MFVMVVIAIMVIKIIMVTMVVIVIRTDRTTRTQGSNKTDRITGTQDRQDRQIWHLNLTFQVTCVGQHSQFVRCLFLTSQICSVNVVNVGLVGGCSKNGPPWPLVCQGGSGAGTRTNASRSNQDIHESDCQHLYLRLLMLISQKSSRYLLNTETFKETSLCFRVSCRATHQH